jgi:putative heme transporter
MVFLIGAAILHRETVKEAAEKLGTLSVISLITIVATVAVHRFIQASLLVATIGDLSLPRAMLANEAYVACTNATVGGGAVGTGVKVAMLRQWGVAPERIATSVTATSVMPAITLWFVAMLGGLWIWSNNLATNLHFLVIGVGAALSIGPLIFWSVVLRSPVLVAFLGRRINTLLGGRRHRFIQRFIPSKVHTVLDRLNVVQQAEGLRLSAKPLLGRQGLLALMFSFLNQATLSLVLISILNGLGALETPTSVGPDGVAGRALAPLGIFAVCSVARTLATFAPLPGGLGVVDAGLLSGLITIGAQRPTAIAAIGLFRAVTFVLPLVTGPITMILWRRTLTRRARQADDRSARHSDHQPGLDSTFATITTTHTPVLGEVA